MQNKKMSKQEQALHFALDNNLSPPEYQSIVEFVADHTDQIIIFCDYSGICKYVNKKACHVLGYDFSESSSVHIQDITRQITTAIWRDIWKSAKEGQPVSGDYLLHARDGRPFFYRLTINYSVIGKKKLCCIIGNESPQDDEIEKELRFEREFATDLVENAKVIICVIDNDDRFIYINPFMEEISGYTYNELKNKRWIDTLFPKTHQSKIRKRFRRVVGDMEISPETFPIVTKRGDIRIIEWFDSIKRDMYGGVKGYYVIGRDITERKKAEDALRKSEIMFRSLAEHSKDIIIRFDIDFKYIYVNPTGLNIIRKKKNEVYNSSLSNISFAGTQTNYLTSLINSSISTGIVHQELLETEGYSGGIVFYDVHIIPEFNQDNDVETVLCIARDITMIKNAADEKAKLEEQLRQSQKMETVGRLAGGIAHDFNNLLTALIGNCELAMFMMDKESKVYKKLEIIYKAGNSAANLTRQLLAFSRKQALDPKVLDLRETIRNMIQMLPRIIGENIELTTRFSKNLNKVKVDPTQIEHVIINMAVNARDAMPEGGKLAIKVSNKGIKDAISEYGLDLFPGDYVLLEISDTGTGIPDRFIDQIFEPFFTTKDIGEGTGLGLSMVYGIIKQSDGDIAVHSELGKGTRFKILLPAVYGDKHKSDVSLVFKDIPKGDEELLIVEDDDRVRELAAEILSMQGYKVQSASGPMQAIELCNERVRPYDLVVSDIIMPKMNGIELYKILAGRWPDMKIMFMSGYAPHAIAKSAIDDLQKPFMQKPFQPLQLAIKVRDIIDGKI